MKKYKSTTEFIDDLSPEQKEIFTLVRLYILEANSTLIENIKWNAPNYNYEGVDRITFNIMNKNRNIRVILHKGAKETEDKKAKPIMQDDTNLISWNSNIRGTLEFTDSKKIQEQHQSLVQIFKNWLTL